MRKAFIETLAGLARTDSRVLLLTGDVGFMAVEPFAEEFPDRFFNLKNAWYEEEAAQSH